MKKDNLELEIKNLVEKFINHLNKEKKEIFLISHFDTDGITSAAIMIQTLKKLDATFSVRIIKSLNKEFIENLPKDKTILFLDLASGSLDYLGVCGIENIFIIDHHEISQEIPKNVHLLNPVLCEDNQKISTSGLVYLFCKEIDQSNKEFAKLAILGMIGDQLEKEIDILNNGVIED
ncbi:MAG: DHH family phosphoesterase, partial [candidate division Zixibacteria bacterium]|nr:DHH family phosphoesterase [candidate division Zixibacteria bacterium]